MRPTRNTIACILAGILGVVALAAILGVWALHTEMARRYLLAVIVEHIEAVTGKPAEIASVRFALLHPAVEFDGIRIHGAETDPLAPLLSIDHLKVNLGFAPFQRQKIYLTSVVATHPVFRVTFDSNGSTLPQARSSSGSENLFDLGIGHTTIERGEAYINDRVAFFSADAQDIDFQASFDASQRAYAAQLHYRRGIIRSGNDAPLVHDLDTSFVASPSGVVVNSIAVHSGDSSFTAQGRLRDYSHQQVELTYATNISAADLQPYLGSSVNGQGNIASSGSASYRNLPDKPALETLEVSGNLESSQLALWSARGRVPVRALKGQFHFHDGTLDVTNTQAQTFDGVFAAELHTQLTGATAGRLRVDLKGASLDSLRRAIAAHPLPAVAVNGVLNAHMEANWSGTIRKAQVTASATWHGSAAKMVSAPSPAPASAARVAIPIDGQILLSYDGNTDSLLLRNSFLRTSASQVTLQGRLGRGSRLQVEARSNDLREVDLFASALGENAAEQAHATPWSGLSGAASFRGDLTGTVGNPRLAGAIAATNLRVRSAQVETASAGVDLSPAGLALHAGQLQSSAIGRAAFDVTLGLRDWQWSRQSALHIRTRLDRVILAKLQEIGALRYPVTGLLSGNAAFDGTVAAPAGQGDFQITNATFWKEPVDSLSVSLGADGKTISGKFDLRAPAGIANGTASYSPADQQYQVHISVPRLRLEQTEYVQGHPISGELVLAANGAGLFANPRMDATLDFSGLQVDRHPIGALHIVAGIARQQAHVTANATISGTPVTLESTTALNGDYETSAELRSGQPVELGPLLAAWNSAAADGFKGQMQLRGTLQGPLKTPGKIQAQLEIPTFHLSYQDAQLSATSPLRIKFADGVAKLEQTSLTGTATELRLAAELDTRQGNVLRGSATGTIDLRLVRIVKPEWQSGGRIKLDVSADGDLRQPNVNGSVELTDAWLNTDPMLPTLEHANGRLTLSGRRIQVANFRGQMGGGFLQIGGTAEIAPAQFSLTATARNIRLLYPDGVRTILGGDLTLSGSAAAAVLGGQINVNRISFAKTFDLSSVTDSITGSVTPSAGLAQNIKLNIALTSRQELDVSAGQLAVQGSADMRIQGTVAEPVLVGRAMLTGGEVFYSGKRFQIQNGVVQFINPTHTEGVVNLTANVTVQQFDVTLNLNGPLDHPNVNYTADPYLAPVDIINLLITGRTVAASQANPSTPQSVVASQLGGQVSNQLQKLTGVSSLTIDPQIGGHGNSGSQLAVQQRVTKNLFFTFATDVTKTQGQTVQVEYQATRRYSVSAIRDQTGGYEVQVKSRKNF